MAYVDTIVKGQAPPDTKVLGTAFGAFSLSIKNQEIEPIFEEVKKKYGYEEIDPEAWYPLQMTLDTYAEVKKQSGDSLILVSMGTTVIDAAKLPDEITTIEQGIRLLMDIHHLNLKNVPEGDGYANLHIEDKKITFEDHTVFPHDVIYGYIYGMAQRFRPEKSRPIVEREYMNKDEPNRGGAKYTITW